jgi:predicted enzyme related to lactoylglutathione lyase
MSSESTADAEPGAAELVRSAAEDLSVATLPAPSAVVFAADVGRLSDFYRRVAAMTVVHADLDHVVLELQGFQLVVHHLAGEPSAPTGRVSVREDSYIKVCLPVASLSEARGTANALGGAVQTADHEWQARGFRACDGHDPEGNVFQVRESLAEPGAAPDPTLKAGPGR